MTDFESIAIAGPPAYDLVAFLKRVVECSIAHGSTVVSIPGLPPVQVPLSAYSARSREPMRELLVTQGRVSVEDGHLGFVLDARFGSPERARIGAYGFELKLYVASGSRGALVSPTTRQGRREATTPEMRELLLKLARGADAGDEIVVVGFATSGMCYDLTDPIFEFWLEDNEYDALESDDAEVDLEWLYLWRLRQRELAAGD